jgi:hypothetical protein
MGDKFYFRGSWKSIRLETNETTGQHKMIFKAAHKDVEADYSNDNNLQYLAFNARKNANDLFNLVMEKYQGGNPVDIDGFEMLVALINLSSELYIKCLIYYYKLNRGKQYKGFHNLKDCFLKLPNEIQLNLQRIDDDFYLKLESISDYFNKFRYSFEYNFIDAESFAFSFAEKLNQICNSIKIQRPAEVVFAQNKMLIKHGEKTIWDSTKKNDSLIISKDD